MLYPVSYRDQWVQRYLRHRLLCAYFWPCWIWRKRFIIFDWGFRVIKGIILNFKNKNLIFNRLSTQISKIKIRFIGTLSRSIVIKICNKYVFIITTYYHILTRIPATTNYTPAIAYTLTTQKNINWREERNAWSVQCQLLHFNSMKLLKTTVKLTIFVPNFWNKRQLTNVRFTIQNVNATV